jgi:hypothetical protein
MASPTTFARTTRPGCFTRSLNVNIGIPACGVVRATNSAALVIPEAAARSTNLGACAFRGAILFSRGRVARMTSIDKADNALTQIKRIRLRHRESPPFGSESYRLLKSSGFKLRVRRSSSATPTTLPTESERPSRHPRGQRRAKEIVGAELWSPLSLLHAGGPRDASPITGPAHPNPP